MAHAVSTLAFAKRRLPRKLRVCRTHRDDLLRFGCIPFVFVVNGLDAECCHARDAHATKTRSRRLAGSHGEASATRRQVHRLRLSSGHVLNTA